MYLFPWGGRRCADLLCRIKPHPIDQSRYAIVTTIGPGRVRVTGSESLAPRRPGRIGAGMCEPLGRRARACRHGRAALAGPRAGPAHHGSTRRTRCASECVPRRAVLRLARRAAVSADRPSCCQSAPAAAARSSWGRRHYDGKTARSKVNTGAVRTASRCASRLAGAEACISNKRVTVRPKRTDPGSSGRSYSLASHGDGSTVSQSRYLSARALNCLCQRQTTVPDCQW